MYAPINGRGICTAGFMNNKWFVGLLILAAVVIVVGILGAVWFIQQLAGISRSQSPEITLGLVIILGVSVVSVLLFILTAGFAALNLTDRRRAFGLPEGSIRALIALFLIVIWVIVSVFLFRFVASESPSDEGIRLAQQLFTTMATLVVAIAAFYFGTNSVAVARGGATPSLPVIRKIIPEKGSQGEELALTIQGKNFRSPKAVKLVQDSEEIVGTAIVSNDSEIHCKIKINADQKPGRWSLMVVNEDGGYDRLAEAFEVTARVLSP